MKSLRRWSGLWLAGACVALPGPVRAETVALWLCDELSGSGETRWLEDRGPLGFHVVLPSGAGLTPGRFGLALRPRPAAAPEIPVENRTGRANASQPGASSRRAAASRLNLGAHDWTIECWLRLDADAAGEGVIFELSTGADAMAEEVTRFSVLPRENAFLLTGLAPVAPGEQPALGRTREIADPGGPPGITVQARAVTLALADAILPRARWFHVALVHRAALREARVFLDGRARAVAAVHFTALPPGDASVVSMGGNARGELALPGAIDELRICDHAAYSGEFAVPGSFASAPAGKR